MRGVPVEDDGVKVTTQGGLFHLNVRLSADVKPLKKFVDSNDVAAMLVPGTVQVQDEAVRVTMRIVVVETSQILEASSGNSEPASQDSVQSAAEHAIADLETLNQ